MRRETTTLLLVIPLGPKQPSIFLTKLREPLPCSAAGGCTPNKGDRAKSELGAFGWMRGGLIGSVKRRHHRHRRHRNRRFVEISTTRDMQMTAMTAVTQICGRAGNANEGIECGGQRSVAANCGT